ncbi:transmembrane protein, putative (macronuclear) [Tetrahymena thermophila SB210]|uniref:Transmembrane protein, putative n=1 Tax=Tetrahymena thermophila (strain SB210) TaxID=312017 RepID=W7X3S3_TETTS|nr:transmembrane protein, putative [Tetrahymena thermophila SB210]EWS73965.1 transmembrane protein, putative [Tetrahymena thermophila SB210]|eukprot:XP_012653506.1 transmembrane protein, putative [Tetrahymena thermophila SB210]
MNFLYFVMVQINPAYKIIINQNFQIKQYIIALAFIFCVNYIHTYIQIQVNQRISQTHLKKDCKNIKNKYVIDLIYYQNTDINVHFILIFNQQSISNINIFQA